MAILNYTTKISPAKTVGEIQEILAKHGAKKIVCDYENGLPSAVSFAIDVDGRLVLFAMPANVSGVLKAMQKDSKIPRSYCNQERATRVAWRIAKDWIEAQCAIIQAGLADMAEIFLPYAVTREGSTLYQAIKGTGFKELTAG